MSLLEEALSAQACKGPPCTVSVFLARLDEPDRVQVVEALGHPDVMTSELYRIMVARGWQPPRPHTLNRHRNRECRCDG